MLMSTVSGVDSHTVYYQASHGLWASAGLKMPGHA